ncbi:MAG TPA: hypothetical protein P5287_04385 [bacterium]|nr:hypothetical protein [bacterium]
MGHCLRRIPAGLCGICVSAVLLSLSGCAAVPLEEKKDNRPLSQQMKSGYNATLKITPDGARVKRVF